MLPQQSFVTSHYETKWGKVTWCCAATCWLKPVLHQKSICSKTSLVSLKPAHVLAEDSYITCLSNIFAPLVINALIHRLLLLEVVWVYHGRVLVCIHTFWDAAGTRVCVCVYYQHCAACSHSGPNGISHCGVWSCLFSLLPSRRM